MGKFNVRADSLEAPCGRTFVHIALSLTLLCLSTAPRPAAAADDASSRRADTSGAIEALVARLGAPSFIERESATRKLKNLGPAVKEPLLKALRHPDPEVQRRATDVLQVILEQDFQARLNAFAADLGGRHEHDLPGWKRYRALIGDDFDARELFIHMLRAEGIILELSEADPEAAGRLLHSRVRRLQGMEINDQDVISSLAAILFVASDPDVSAPSEEYPLFARNNEFVVFNYLLSAQTPHVIPLRKIVSAWIEREETNTNALYTKLLVAVFNDLPAGVKPGLSLASSAPLVLQKQRGILTVGRFGAAEHIPQIERFLTDETTEPNGAAPTQVRDVALAVCVHLAGLDLAEFGFKNVEKDPRFLFAPESLGFKNPADREAALAKWKQVSKSLNKPAAEPRGET